MPAAINQVAPVANEPMDMPVNGARPFDDIHTKRQISHSEAHEIANRLINSHFRQEPHARVGIPARPDYDDDLLISAYIKQREAAEADATVVERVAKAIARVGEPPYDPATDDLTIPLAFRLVYVERQRDALVKALRAAIKLAEMARKEWDEAPEGMRAGKLLTALAGHVPNYNADTAFIHSVMREAEITNAS